MSVEYDTNREFMERLDADRKMVRDAKKLEIQVAEAGLERHKKLLKEAIEDRDELEEDIRQYGWTRGDPQERRKRANFSVSHYEKEVARHEDKLERLR